MGASSLLLLHYSNLQIRHIPATNQLFLQTVTFSIKSTVAQVNVSDKKYQYLQFEISTDQQIEKKF